jgi:hypothetical protein
MAAVRAGRSVATAYLVQTGNATAETRSSPSPAAARGRTALPDGRVLLVGNLFHRRKEMTADVFRDTVTDGNARRALMFGGCGSQPGGGSRHFDYDGANR